MKFGLKSTSDSHHRSVRPLRSYQRWPLTIDVDATALFLVDVDQTALFQPFDGQRLSTSIDVHFTALSSHPVIIVVKNSGTMVKYFTDGKKIKNIIINSSKEKFCLKIIFFLLKFFFTSFLGCFTTFFSLMHLCRPFYLSNKPLSTFFLILELFHTFFKTYYLPSVSSNFYYR